MAIFIVAVGAINLIWALCINALFWLLNALGGEIKAHLKTHYSTFYPLQKVNAEKKF